MRFNTITRIGVVLGFLLAPSLAQGAFLFDANGDTAGDPLSDQALVDVMNWAPDNVLFVDIVPIPSFPNSSSGPLYLQGSLASLTGCTGGLCSLDAGAEITYSADIQIEATVVTSTFGIDFALTTTSGGTFEIYYDDSAGLNTTGGSAYDQIAGTGYDDGRLILSADVLPGAIGNVNVDSTNLGNLDQFGANDQVGVTTVTVAGNFTYLMDINFLDSLFFLGDTIADNLGTDGEDLTFTTDNTAPFLAANPSDLVGGVQPDYDGSGSLTGINDNLCATSSPCDLHAQTDGRSVFRADDSFIVTELPEPSTFALFSVGLAGLGFAMWRRRG